MAGGRSQSEPGYEPLGDGTERLVVFFFSSRRRHTRCGRDWSSDVCSSDPPAAGAAPKDAPQLLAIAGHPSGRRLPLGGGWAAEVAFDRLRVGRGSVATARELVASGERGRSEERRVGKEWREGWWARDGQEE